jgi:hypothetical protein
MMIATAVIGALAVGAHTSGMVDLKKAPQELGLFASDPRSIIVAADITAGREKELQKDFEAVQKLIDTARLGEKIEVYLIHSRAEASQEAIFKAEMPGDEGPMGMAFKRAQKKAKESFADSWNKGINAALGDSRLVQQTDLFGFFRFVSQRTEFRKSKKPILIVFTDGQQVGDGFNFERTIPIDRDLKRAKNAELMPDLTGVTVTMSGVTPTHNISNLHWRKLQSWWREYLKEAGAEVTAISSDRSSL